MTDYDILILGGGPIGAATAYFLTKNYPDTKVGLVTQDPTDDHSATYLYAGGSIRWFWDDPVKAEATKNTADFIKNLLSQGVDLSAIEDNYLFLHRGVFVPSLNVSGAKLVNYFLDEAKKKGLEVHSNQQIKSVKLSAKGWQVETTQGSFEGKKVLCALGIANAKFVPDLELEPEKRQLFVTDVKIDESRQNFPHVIFPVGEGVVYAFVKKTQSGLRLLVGQEDVVETNDELEAEDYFKKLLEAGVGDLMPILKDAKVESILWGVDVGNKDLLTSENDGLFSANCGSAVRSCVAIGETVGDLLTK